MNKFLEILLFWHGQCVALHTQGRLPEGKGLPIDPCSDCPDEKLCNALISFLVLVENLRDEK